MGDPKKVLLVEDDRATRLIIRRALEAAGFEVVTAVNYDEALACVEAHDPDVVVLDLVLAESRGDGADTLRVLRERPESADLPVIVSTGLTDGVGGSRLEAAKQWRPDAVFGKPYRVSELLRRVEELAGVARPATAG